MSAIQKTVAVDTSVWLLCCARKTTGDAMSEIDKQFNVASESREVKKLRGLLFKLLCDHDVVIPQTTLDELKLIEAGSTKIANAGNKEDLQVLIQAMEGRTVRVVPTPTQINRQHAFILKIKEAPEDSPEGKAWKNKLWKEEGRTKAAAQLAAQSSHLPVAPWMQAETNLQELAKLREANPLDKRITKQIQDTEKTLPSLTPYVIPDYQILLCAEQAQATVITRDKDYMFFWRNSPDMASKTWLRPLVIDTVGDTHSLEVSIQKLTNKLAEKSKTLPEIS